MKLLKNIFLLLPLFIFKQSKGQISADSVHIPNAIIDSGLIYFKLPKTSTVSLRVYSRWGNMVRDFYHDSILSPGSYSVILKKGSLPGGAYMLALDIDSDAINKFVLLKGNTTSIEEFDNISSPCFFPNPTSKFLNIPIDGKKQITIYDVEGRVCLSETVSANIISLAPLKQGIYVISVLADEEQTSGMQRIVKLGNGIK